jgi:hypothetical protein
MCDLLKVVIMCEHFVCVDYFIINDDDDDDDDDVVTKGFKF